MKSIVQVLTFVSVTLISFESASQDFLQYERDVEDIAIQIPGNIHNEDVCDVLISQLDGIESDIEEIFEEDISLSADAVHSLKKAAIQSDALSSFLRAISASSNGGFITKKQLNIVRQILDFMMFDIYMGKFCVNLYEIRIGLYKAIIALQREGDKDLKLVAYIKSNEGLNFTKMEMGLAFHEYRKIWSNEDDLTDIKYEVIKIECNYLKDY